MEEKDITIPVIVSILIVIGVVVLVLIKSGSKSTTDTNIGTSGSLTAQPPAMQSTESNSSPYNSTPTNSPTESTVNEQVGVTAKISTTEGNMTVQLNTDITPKTAGNFIELANKGFYNNTIFHRVIEGFMIQGGDPTGTGRGGPGYKFDDEPFEGEYTRGTMAMANSGPNTNGSQFFIMHQDYALPKNYVIFGKLIEGFETLDKIATAQVTMSESGEASKPVNPVSIIKVEIISAE